MEVNDAQSDGTRRVEINSMESFVHGEPQQSIDCAPSVLGRLSGSSCFDGAGEYRAPHHMCSSEAADPPAREGVSSLGRAGGDTAVPADHRAAGEPLFGL